MNACDSCVDIFSHGEYLSCPMLKKLETLFVGIQELVGIGSFQVMVLHIQVADVFVSPYRRFNTDLCLYPLFVKPHPRIAIPLDVPQNIASTSNGAVSGCHVGWLIPFNFIHKFAKRAYRLLSDFHPHHDVSNLRGRLPFKLLNVPFRFRCLKVLRCLSVSVRTDTNRPRTDCRSTGKDRGKPVRSASLLRKCVECQCSANGSGRKEKSSCSPDGQNRHIFDCASFHVAPCGAPAKDWIVA